MSNCTTRMSRLLLVFILSFTFTKHSEAIHDNKELPSAVVVGTVYCDTCSQQGFSKTTSHFISGASVAVECNDRDDSNSRFYKEAKTNENGEFKVYLPVSLTKQIEKIKECTVKLLSSSEPFCAVTSMEKSSSSQLQLKGRREEEEGTHIFSAGVFTFKPSKQPDICNQKPNLFPKKPYNSMKLSVSVPRVPEIQTLVSSKNFLFPPIFPSPPPTIGGIPLPPNPLQPPPLLPPVPFQPPPTIGLPPIPGLTTPPPPASIFPPLIPPLVGLPPIPGLTPPPSPPPPASIFPPLIPPGFPGIPGFPGHPPSSSSSSYTSSAEEP